MEEHKVFQNVILPKAAMNHIVSIVANLPITEVEGYYPSCSPGSSSSGASASTRSQMGWP